MSVEVTVVPGTGITGLGLKVAVAPVGRPEPTDRLILEVNPVSNAKETVYVVEPPGIIVWEAGVTDMVKSGTVKVLSLLLAIPLTVTTTAPVVAPLGTDATICVSLQLVIVVAVTPLNVTVLVPWVAPKLRPVIVTDVPAEPEVGANEVIVGGGAVLRRMETLALAQFATARSGFPSPFRSPMAMECGLVPTAKFVAAPNEPVPVPRRMETSLPNSFATARSGLPSPFKSLMATENGPTPATKFVAAPNVPVPVPRRMETLALA